MKKAFPWFREKSHPDGNGKVMLRGKCVVLREKRLSDVPEDYAWRTDRELSHLDATQPLGMSFEAFERYAREEIIYANASSNRLAIDTLDGRHIGNCMCYDVDLKRGRAELGIMIGDRDYWSKGYGTDSVDTLLRHMFSATSLDLVYLHTLDWNHRARRSFGKVGFREVKKVRRGGLSFILMEIPRSDWERREPDVGAKSTCAPDNGASPDEALE